MELLILHTDKEMAAERLSTALLNGLQGPEMRGWHPGATLSAVRGAMEAADVRELYHFSGVLWILAR